jgi:hypothetical protein
MIIGWIGCPPILAALAIVDSLSVDDDCDLRKIRPLSCRLITSAIDNRVQPRLLEFRKELIDDAVGQHVGHFKNLRVNIVVGGDVSSPIAVQPRNNLTSRGFLIIRISPNNEKCKALSKADPSN